MATVDFVTQLWATAADADELGVPAPALASKTAAQKERALRAASGILATYVRGPYEVPLSVRVEETSAEGFTTGTVTFEGAPREAIAAMARVVTGGAVGAGGVVVERSLDGGSTWETSETLSATGRLEWPSATVVMAFAGVLTEGAVARFCAGIDWGIRQYTVDLGAYTLVFNRGVDPGSPEGQELSKRRDAAMAWARDVQKRGAKLAEGADATPGLIEQRPRGGRRRSSAGYLRWRAPAGGGDCG